MLRVVSTIMTIFLSAIAALAADKTPPEPKFEIEATPPMPVFSWTGGYIGAQAGYGFGEDSVTVRRAASVTPSRFNPNGITGGFHAGYNYALDSKVGGITPVVGLESDIDGADYQRKATALGGLPAGTTASLQSDIKGSIRGRVGIGANRTLLYATGGAAFANFDTRYNGTSAFGSGAFNASDRLRAGYTVGGGLEYAFLNYASLRAEYRYTNYGVFTDNPDNAAPGLNAALLHRESDSRLQAGISYKLQSIVP